MVIVLKKYKNNNVFPVLYAFFFHFTVNYTCMERSAAQSLVTVHVPPYWEEGGRHIESYAAALAITAVDRSGACELACLSGCLSPLGQNISLPLKPLPPGLCHHTLSLCLSLCLSEERLHEFLLEDQQQSTRLSVRDGREFYQGKCQMACN